MLSNEVDRLEMENQYLRSCLNEFERKLKDRQTLKPRSCRLCKNYIQHYRKTPNGYAEVNAGHCISCVPVKKGGKRNPFPSDTCPYFELGKEII